MRTSGTGAGAGIGPSPNGVPHDTQNFPLCGLRVWQRGQTIGAGARSLVAAGDVIVP